MAAAARRASSSVSQVVDVTTSGFVLGEVVTEPANGTNPAVFEVDLPTGAELATFAIFGQDYPPGTDLDLFIYRELPDGNFEVRAGGDTRGGARRACWSRR